MDKAADIRSTIARRRRRAALLLPALLAVGSQLPAQGVDPGELKEAMAVRVSGDDIRVDGRLDDPAWRQAVFFSDFRQRDPVYGAQPSDRTEVAFLYDDAAIYVGARMHSSEPDRIPASLTRHDGFGRAEHLTVSFDPFLDRRTSFSFTVTSGNGRRDFVHTSDSDDGRSRDYTWNPVWEGKAVRDSLGWTLEMRIPLSQLRFPGQPVHVWGLNVHRGMPQRNEDVFWIAVPRDVPGYVSRFGTLHGIAAIPTSRRMELLPYAAGNGRFTGSPVPGDPFDDGSVTGQSIGADLKMGLGASLTLDATFNPDFGQVDADPAEVNLSAFESFFPERRPFFTEGSELLSGGGTSYFHSRRVGASPRGPASADFVDRPGSSRILGAAKLTGRIGPGWQLGLFSGITERTYARTYDSIPDEVGSVEIEPVAAYGAGRLQHQFGASGSTLGFTLATMRRLFTAESPLADRFSRQALSGGTDWSLRFRGGDYTVNGRAGFSYVGGTEAAILRLQESPARYFQRPDAGYVEVDPERTSLVGFSAGVSANKNSGMWLWGASLDTDSPGFETNDTGRLQNGDDIGLSANVTRRQTEPSALFRRSRLNLSGRVGWNYGGIRRDAQVRLSTSANFHNYWDANLNLQYNPRSISDGLTRGGPLMQTGWRTRLDGNLTTSSSSPTTVRIGGALERGEFGAWLAEVSFRLSANPLPTLTFSIDPGYSRRVSARQYVGRFSDGSEATYGARYVFAKIERSQLAMRARFNYLFSPTLSVEGYAEPFSASGRYFEFGELAQAGSRFLRVYGQAPGTTLSVEDRQYRVEDAAVPGSFTFNNPDFNSLSFRSNLVLRWEWNPGSTLFLVWQQNRSDFCRAGTVTECPNGSLPGSLATVGSFADPFRVAGDNFVAVKVTYWISVR
jgi:hypothetical protein